MSDLLKRAGVDLPQEGQLDLPEGKIPTELDEPVEVHRFKASEAVRKLLRR